MRLSLKLPQRMQEGATFLDRQLLAFGLAHQPLALRAWSNACEDGFRSTVRARRLPKRLCCCLGRGHRLSDRQLESNFSRLDNFLHDSSFALCLIFVNAWLSFSAYSLISGLLLCASLLDSPSHKPRLTHPAFSFPSAPADFLSMSQSEVTYKASVPSQNTRSNASASATAMSPSSRSTAARPTPCPPSPSLCSASASERPRRTQTSSLSSASLAPPCRRLA
jgi:hypothetical protein